LLLNLLALAFRASHFPFVVFCQCHDQAERLIAFLAEIFVLGHRRCPPRLFTVILAENASCNKDSDDSRRSSAHISFENVTTVLENPNSSRQGAKAQRDAQLRPLLFFASFAYFAALREIRFCSSWVSSQPGKLSARQSAGTAELDTV
jgi:hypothetical protein